MNNKQLSDRMGGSQKSRGRRAEKAISSSETASVEATDIDQPVHTRGFWKRFLPFLVTEHC